jgi:hypothetical protein
MRHAAILLLVVSAGCDEPDLPGAPVDAGIADAVADGALDAPADVDAGDADADADAAPVDPTCAPRPKCGACAAGETCGGAGVVAVCGSRACTHYVSPTATLTAFASCTDASNPCTLATANDAASPGDVVCLADGEYHTAIAPKTSGSAREPITFLSTSREARIRGVSNGISLASVSFIEIDGVGVLGGTNTANQVTRFFNLVDADDCWIRNGTFVDALAYVGSRIDEASQRNKITNNTFPDAPHAPLTPEDDDGETWPADTLEIFGDANLVQDNDFGDTSHYAIVVWVTGGHRNVVRRNHLHNGLHAGMNLLSFDGSTGRLLVEGNRILDSGIRYLDNPNKYSRTHATSSDDGLVRGRQVSIQLAADGVLVRRNEVAGGGRGLSISGWDYNVPPQVTTIHPLHTRVAHNTFYENLTNLMLQNDVTSMPVPFVDIAIKDNIFFNLPAHRECHGQSITPDTQLIESNGWSTDGRFRFIRSQSMPDDRPLAAVQMQYAPYWADNVSLTPKFADVSEYDLRLAADSPGIDQADWLTTITSESGSGASLTVADALWFSDGFGAELGDVVRTSRGELARITKIEGANVTLDATISWQKDDGITLAYTGDRPDLGAHELCP